MTFVIAGLGNPGEEYQDTRHNTGRIMLEAFRKAEKFPEFQFDKKMTALVSRGQLKKEKIILVEPETFMNRSGKSLALLITSAKKAEQFVVIHDDLDLPLGSMKISFNRGSGGHRGLESIIRSIKTRGFTRVRIGISRATPSGKIKKPKGEEGVNDFIIAPFAKAELDTIKKISKKVTEAMRTLILESREKAMSQFNG
ncbi:MAG: aminoacyl-tRNA hydrolase [bacterium]|nr:aminoacyl-tRNA hydrolase [bacterium]